MHNNQSVNSTQKCEPDDYNVVLVVTHLQKIIVWWMSTQHSGFNYKHIGWIYYSVVECNDECHLPTHTKLLTTAI